ncbi:hypothetical protein KC19_VG262200 [Ceratodon purpureus]|uniref:Secreted protein n=1 Tax=Ceratodon purpureus TaxID=3225 RepID=A0A8T0HVF2_CERPU|nr:hypothetical protein KC19_VG262200 [Ceratodon purpureus]
MDPHALSVALCFPFLHSIPCCSVPSPPWIFRRVRSSPSSPLSSSTATPRTRRLHRNGCRNFLASRRFSPILAISPGQMSATARSA